MRIILEIPDEEVEIIKRNGFNKDGTFSFKLNEVVKQAIRNGIVLPDNATNGNIFCLFNNVSRFFELHDCVEVEVEVRPNIIWTSQFDKEWWNTKWEGGQEDGNDN